MIYIYKNINHKLDLELRLETLSFAALPHQRLVDLLFCQFKQAPDLFAILSTQASSRLLFDHKP